MDANLRLILQQLEAEKSLDRETLLEAIRSAIESAAHKSFAHAGEVKVEIDDDTLQPKVFEIRTVVEQVADPGHEMSLDAARELNPDVQIGNRLKVPTEPRDFGRIAAQTAKQVIIQKIKDAKRDRDFDEFRQREGEVVVGVIRRQSHGNIIVQVDGAEAVLPQREQSTRENFRPGDRVRAYVLKVDRGVRGPQIILSRAAPELVRALFELEVPEIYDGTIEIRSIAREAGARTKIAVYSNDLNVDAVGACVGMKGSRVRAVVEELSGEKIDIVRWSSDPEEFCGNALNPADILDIGLDEENKAILVVVPSDQLSLAIGKRGQNARLASRLIGWSIDIRSDEEISLAGDSDSEASETPSEASAQSAVETQVSEAIDAPPEEAPEHVVSASEEDESPQSADADEDQVGP